ncbi:DUF1217 domain-containing protein [Jannaschia sp. Os4]|uniref:DUF1217 domain-containing protein n=1 Tax=Jannaschia sp. Os4 TaxID=2807617 RepID=UPI00193934FB|nr:DUF1217 domain-containing protein [Jannaschia sp. Os4]MBM2575673.1 DUF1217 domain-containing protein [Jannaschia sp. Os4]
MIPITGLPSLLALKLVDATRGEQTTALRERSGHARGIETFRARAGGPATADAFVEDNEVYAFAMRAFGLGDRIFGKGMMRRVLASDASDPASLVNRLSDPRFSEMHAALGFGTGDAPRLGSEPAREALVDRYVDRQFTDAVTDGNAAVGAALAFRAAAPGIGSAYDILADAELSTVVRTALGIPPATAGLDIDRQAQMIERRLDLSSLDDPTSVDRLVRKYLVLSDAATRPVGAASGALTVLSGSQSRGLVEIAAVFASGRGRYTG